jgi:hypothetical protein
MLSPRLLLYTLYGSCVLWASVIIFIFVEKHDREKPDPDLPPDKVAVVYKGQRKIMTIPGGYAQTLTKSENLAYTYTQSSAKVPEKIYIDFYETPTKTIRTRYTLGVWWLHLTTLTGSDLVEKRPALKLYYMPEIVPERDALGRQIRREIQIVEGALSGVYRMLGCRMVNWISQGPATMYRYSEFDGFHNPLVCFTCDGIAVWGLRANRDNIKAVFDSVVESLNKDVYSIPGLRYVDDCQMERACPKTTIPPVNPAKGHSRRLNY